MISLHFLTEYLSLIRVLISICYFGLILRVYLCYMSRSVIETNLF
ncbi:hypothetical protein HanRHA438_Chr17g0807351 [Helianthus annuus]|nr:hypothetical protein HanRHA438_Chr17g0807351 [Helianthus annuus]